MFDTMIRPRSIAPATREALLQLLLTDAELEAVDRKRAKRGAKYSVAPGLAVQGLDPASDAGLRSMARFYLRVADHLEIMLDREIEYYCSPDHEFGFGSDATKGTICFDEGDDFWAGCWTDMEGEREIPIPTAIPTNPRAVRALGAKGFAREIACRVLWFEGSFISESD
jgi:hypothetical protein